MKAVVPAIAAITLFGVTAAQAQTAYRLTDLGMLPGCSISAAAGITETGEVLGSCGADNSFFAQSGWTFQGGTLATTGKLPGGLYSAASAGNNLGAVVGYGDTGNYRPQALLFRDGQVYNIDPVSGGNAYAIGITDTGAIFGDLTSSLSGNTNSWRVVMWTEEPSKPGRFRRTQLPMPTQAINNKTIGVFALGSSNTGYVAGWATSDLIGQQGALWTNDAAHTLVILNGLGGTSIAQAVNDSGVAVGWSQDWSSVSPGVIRAVVWSGDPSHAVTNLGVLPGDDSSAALAVNNTGQILGVSYGATERHPFVYENGQMTPLASLLDASAAGWTVDDPVAINDAGQIAGSGIVNGQRHAFLLTRVQ